MDSDQTSFTDLEYGQRRRGSRREQFLTTMDTTIPWARWVELIEPHYYAQRPGKKGAQGQADRDDVADVSAAGLVLALG
jgi:IS5 family transposase